MKTKDIGIDLGTTSVLIYEKGNGIVLSEPSVVAVDKVSKKVIAVGNIANEMLGKAPDNVLVIKPLKDGVIADFDKTEIMLNYFIKSIKCKSLFLKPKIVICCPSNITQVEKNAIKEVAERTGAKKVLVEEEPKVAAIGSGIDISKPIGNMIIDIGGGTTDIAVLSMNSIVYGESVKIAGNTLDSNIADYIKEKYKLLIGECTASKVKEKIGTMIPDSKDKKISINGRDCVTGLPNNITITSNEIYDSIKKSIDIIIQSAKKVLEKVGPEISSDIIENGITLTGGGALLNGIDSYIQKELNIKINLANNPLTSVAEGTGVILDSFTI